MSDMFRVMATSPFLVEVVPQKNRREMREAQEADEPRELLRLWEGRHSMKGGLLEALEKINTLLEVKEEPPTESAVDRVDAIVARTESVTPRALQKLVHGLAACAHAQGKLQRKIQATCLPVDMFRVLDPHGAGSCEAAHVEAFMRQSGMSDDERAAVLARLGATDVAIEEATFVREIERHFVDYYDEDPRTRGAERPATAYLHDPRWTPRGPERILPMSSH